VPLEAPVIAGFADTEDNKQGSRHG
jgi:hypothetical protein